MVSGSCCSSGAACPSARPSRRRPSRCPRWQNWPALRSARPFGTTRRGQRARWLRCAGSRVPPSRTGSASRPRASSAARREPAAGCCRRTADARAGNGSVRVLADVVSGADGGRGMWRSELGRLRNWRWNPVVRVDLEGSVRPLTAAERPLGSRSGFRRPFTAADPPIAERCEPFTLGSPTGEPLCRLRRIQPSRREKSWVSDPGTRVAHPSGSLNSVRLHDSALCG